MKGFTVCKSGLGYIWNCSLYCTLGCTMIKICDDLLEPLYDRNYKVFTDNFYNGVPATIHLLENQTHLWNYA